MRKSLIGMKKILVVYYSQTGQWKDAMETTFRNHLNDPEIEFTYAQIQPAKSYPYPWSYFNFWNAFPETVLGVPCELKPIEFDETKTYDLILLGYQPWFLSICIPVNSFLLSPQAEKILKGKPVITILNCRNMWLNGQEKVKTHLKRIGADLVGNLTFVDKAPNLVSLVTVFAHAFGVKGRFLGIFPKYGVKKDEIESYAPRLGDTIIDHLRSGSYEGMQEELVNNGGVTVKPNLLLLEGRGKILFPIYARFVSRGKSKLARAIRLRIFGIGLPILILIASPIITLISRLSPLLFKKKLESSIAYYKQTSLKA